MTAVTVERVSDRGMPFPPVDLYDEDYDQQAAAELLAEEQERAEEAELRRMAGDGPSRFSRLHAAVIAKRGYVRRSEGMDLFPVEPLLQRCEGRSIMWLTRNLGTEWANVHRARREGLTWAAADRWAVALGVHPALIWGEAWWDSARREPYIDDDTVFDLRLRRFERTLTAIRRQVREVDALAGSMCRRVTRTVRGVG